MANEAIRRGLFWYRPTPSSPRRLGHGHGVHGPLDRIGRVTTDPNKGSLYQVQLPGSHDLRVVHSDSFLTKREMRWVRDEYGDLPEPPTQEERQG